MEEFYGSGIIFFNVIDTQEAAAELFLFTAAKNYGHKCFITERKQREMGHNTEPLFVNKPPDVSSKPTEKRGLLQLQNS